MPKSLHGTFIDTRIRLPVTTHSKSGIPAKACNPVSKDVTPSSGLHAHRDMRGHVQICIHMFTVLLKEIKFTLYVRT